MFPEDFLFGACVSDYQHFGGSICDWPTIDAALHHKLYKEDFKLVKELGLSAFRTAIEWSRIEPEENTISKEALDFYHEYFKELKKTGVKTFVTLHHFTNPKWISKYGGWENKQMVQKFLDYVSLVVEEFGKYIDFYLTVNEPVGYAFYYAYGRYPPYKKAGFMNFIKCMENFVSANDQAYKIIKGLDGKSKVGFTYSATIYRPQTSLGSITSNVTNLINFEILKRFSKSSDFIGINYYANTHIDWRGRPRAHRVNPSVLREICNRAYKKCNKPIVITENGIPTNDDSLKSAFLVKHLEQIAKCINEDKVDIKGYMWWSFLHGYEWLAGYEPKFSLIDVDMKTAKRSTTKTAEIYSRIAGSRSLDEVIDPANLQHAKLLEFNSWPSNYYF